ncbi:LPD38 domain-containing protein [Flavobacterium sp. GNP002]
MLQPKKQNGLTPEDNKILIQELTNYANEGASDEDLRVFRETFISTKKKSTPKENEYFSIAPNTKSVSEPKAGSLGGKATQGFPQIDTNSVAPGMGVQPTAETAQAKEKRLRKELANVKVTPENMDQVMADTDALSESVKQNKKAAEQAKSARVKKLETSFYAATQNNDDAIEADKRLNDKLNNKGFVNNIVSASKSAFNTVLGAVASTSPTLAGLAFMGVNEDPLADEKKLAKKEALKNNEKLSDDQINERAKEIFKEKEKENLFIDRANSFLDDLDAEDRNLLKQDRYDKGIHLQEDNVKRLKYNAALQTVAEDKIKEYQSIESQLKKLESNKQPFPEELYAKYTALSGEIKNLSSTIKKNQDYIQKNKKDLGTTEQEFDLFKREYGDLYNFASNFSVSAGELAINTLSGLEYLGTLGGNIGDDKKNQGVQNDLNAAQQDLKQERDKLRKSVESIESSEGLLNYASDLLANQIPNLLATSTGAKGLAMVGTASAGQKYTEMAEEVRQGKASYTPLQMAFSPLLYGGAEVISEIPTLSILKNGGRVFESIAKNETQLIAKTAKQKAIEWSKDYGVDMSKEMAGEQFTNFTQNFNDKYVLGKKDVNLLDNTGRVFKDTFTLTSILKVSPHTFGVIAKPFQSKKDLGVLDENSRKIIEFSQQLNTQGLTDTEKNAIQKQIDKATTESSKIVANTIGSIENMPGELYDEVISLNSKAGEIKAQAKAINDGKLPNKKDLLKGLAEDYKALQEQRSAIIDGKTTVVDVLPLQEQETLKRQAMEDLVTELNPDGTKNITITNEQVVERANKIFAESKANESTTTQTSTPTSTEEAAPSVTIPPIPEDYNIVDPQPKTEVNLPLSPTESQQNGEKVEGNSPKKIELTDEDKAVVQKKVVEEPRVLLRRGAVGEDAFFALPNEGIYGEVVDKVGADQDYTAYQYPEDFKIKDLSNDVVFDDYMSNKMFEQTKEEGYDAAYVMEIDGSKVLHVINPGKLTLLDEKLPELRDNKKQPVVEQTTPDTKAQPSEVAPSVSSREEGSNKKPTIVVHGSVNGFGLQYSEGINKENIVTPQDARGFLPREEQISLNEGNSIIKENSILDSGDKKISILTPDMDSFGRSSVNNFEFTIPTDNNSTTEGLQSILDNVRRGDLRGKELIDETVKQVKEYIDSNAKVKNEASSPSNNPADGNVRPRVNNVEEVREANGNSNKGETVQNSVDGRENQGKNKEVTIDGDDLILKHGTPHNFDKFQLEKIGTGEGAQAFGYGLYFTDGSKIAESYARKLSNDKTGIVYSVRIIGGRTANWAEWRQPLDETQEQDLYNALTPNERKQYQDHLDKAFDYQSPNYDIKYEKDYHGSFEDLKPNSDGTVDYGGNDKPVSAGGLYSDLKDAFGQEKATDIFKRAGIDGIKYRSKNGIGDNYNYVVFNPDSITIEEKSNKNNEVNDVAAKTGVKASNLRDLYKINQKVFGQNRVKALAAAIVMDRMIGSMAKRAKVSKSEIYSKLDFKKGDKKTFDQLSKNGKALFQIVGTNAKLSKNVKENLKVARTMEAAGKNSQEIRVVTGWEKGADDKWGYEIDDSKVAIKNEIQSGQKLSDLLDHPELFEMYPELGNVSIVVNNRMDFSAVAIAESNKILINETANTDPKELKATILHEVQHLIQYKEGWSLGATPDAIRQKLNEAANNNSKIKSSVKKIIRTVFSKQTGLMIDDVKARKLLGKQDFELYLSLSGETQSRNVESRMDFTSEERRNATLESTEDVRREEQIVLFQEGKGAVEIAEDGQAVIYALTDPNISTPLHELAHVYEQYLTAADKKTILEWSKQKEWTRETSENFAKGFEKYLADGIAPTAELQKIFEKFKDWLTEIYEGIKDSEIDLEISPKMQNVYAKMLGEKAVNLQNPKNEKNGKQKTNSGTKEKGDGKNNDIDSKTKNGGSQNEGSSEPKKISLKGRTPLTKRKFRGDRARANNIQPVDAKSLVLQYFIGGGRVTKEAILKLYRGSENEFKARTKIGGYAFENSGKSIDEIAHDIWERRSDVDVDTSDIKEAVEAVISEHSRISSMVQDMLTYEDMQPVDDINQLEEDQQMFEEVQEEFAATPEEMQTAINLLDQLTDDEIIRLAEEKELSFEQFIEDLDARQVTFDMGPFVGERGTLLDNGNIVSESGELILSNQVSNVKKIERNDDSNANGIDEIANEQNRKKELTNERVSYEKRTPKNAPKKLSEIIKSVSSGLRSHLIYSRPKKSNVLGTYNPRNTLVRITRAGDIDTVAHELGHLLDDRFDLLGTISKGVEIAILRQLKWYSDRGGSNPPAAASASQKREYLQREGLAEFIRSYIANPSQTKIIAPELLAHFENTIDAKTKAVLDQFSDDYLDLANASAIEKTLSNVEEIDLPNKNKFIEWLKSFRKSEDKLSFTAMDKFYAEMANSNHFGIKAFKTLLAMQGKTDVKSSENFEIMSRLFSGINGKLENIFAQGMINAKNERLKAEGGVFTKNSKGRTEYKDGTAMNVAWLVNGLDTTSEETLKKDMNEVIAMAVAERTIEYAKKFGRTDNLTGAGAGIETDLSVAINTLNEFEDLKKTDKAKYDRINDGVKRYRQMADATLQYAVDKGRISQEQYKQIKASNEYYVALNRNKELQPGDDLFSSFNTGTNGIGAAKEIIKKAKGGTNTIENPYLSLLRNMNNIIKEADRNEVMLSFVEPLISTRRMGEGEPIDLSKIGFLANDGDAETIKVFRNGKLEKWKFDEEIFKSLKNIESVASNPIMDIISSPSKLIRWTVTHNPVFYARNIVKDTQARMIISNNHSTFVDMIHNSGDKELFELFGGSQAGHLHTSKESYAKTMKGTIKEITKKGGIVLSPKMLADKYMKFLQTGENLNRIAEFNAAYKVAKKQGMSDYDAGLYAAFQARDLMDFAVAGHTMREINKIIVFSNAGVQSIRKASKSIKKDPAGFAYRTALYSVIPSMAFALLRNMMGDDDEYENLPDNQRDMFFNFKTAATGDAWISIPKPYELGLTSAFVDRAVSKVRGNDQAFDGIIGTTMKTLMPFDESSFLGGLKPIIETQMNRNTFTDRSIVPEWESGKLLELRKGVENASLISQKTSNLFKKAGWSVDPRNIDHILRGYGTYFANQGMAISDLAKEDRAELNFWITKSGFAKDIPTYNAKSVKKATELAVEIGKVNSKPMKSLRDNIEKFYEETNLVKRKEILKEIYAKSEDLIKKFEEDKVEILNKEKRPD